MKIIKRAKNYLHRKIFSGGEISSKLLVHFTYHKCLTVYYNRIFNHFSAEYKFNKQHFEKIEEFVDCLNVPEQSGLFTIHLYRRHKEESINDRWPDNPDMPRSEKMAISHFTRHPKDLIVSGYKYHLWCNEPFFTSDSFKWERYIQSPIFKECVLPKHGEPNRESYRSFLNRIDKFSGMVIECLFRETTFPIMENWNYANPNCLTQRYEDIVGNEMEAFERLIEHYQIKKPYRNRLLELADLYSLKNQKTKARSHVRDGRSRQWEDEFTPQLDEVFHRLYPELLKKTGYQ